MALVVENLYPIEFDDYLFQSNRDWRGLPARQSPIFRTVNRWIELEDEISGSIAPPEFSENFFRVARLKKALLLLRIVEKYREHSMWRMIRTILAGFLLNRLDFSTDTLLGSCRGNSYEKRHYLLWKTLTLKCEGLPFSSRSFFFSLIIIAHVRSLGISLFTGIIFRKYWKLNCYFWWCRFFCIIICLWNNQEDIIFNYYNIIIVYDTCIYIYKFKILFFII